jgi:hypothetical protein
MLIFKHIAPVLILTGCLAQFAAAATPKASLLCAITNVSECEVLKGCSNHLPVEVNFPQFFTIDFKRQTISGKGRTDKIGTIEFTAEGIILQGVGSQHRAWSLVLNNEQTRVTGHVTGQHYGFTLFGVCQPEI